MRSLASFALSLALAAAAPATPARAGERAGAAGPEALLARMAALPGLSARFVEERRVALLVEPLRSEGELHFVPPARFARRILRPSPSLLVLDGKRLWLGGPSGGTALELGAQPAVQEIVSGFVAVLAGDVATLRRLYEVEFEADAGGWALALVPQSATARRTIARIALRGHDVTVDELRVEEASGDVSVTRFTHVEPGRRFSDQELDQLFRVPGG
jgi:outer membrane lipoprotein-sorting protein